MHCSCRPRGGCGTELGHFQSCLTSLQQLNLERGAQAINALRQFVRLRFMQLLFVIYAIALCSFCNGSRRFLQFLLRFMQLFFVIHAMVFCDSYNCFCCAFCATIWKILHKASTPPPLAKPMRLRSMSLGNCVSAHCTNSAADFSVIS